ncbi:hypothetical protein F4778DRAFT_85715 [Xylariomycetidae sp. FL2044]|nr:hypothetical protein F4778DRAFT_85715 [Xylariomycetidae sp. FL2044]
MKSVRRRLGLLRRRESPTAVPSTPTDTGHLLIPSASRSKALKLPLATEILATPHCISPQPQSPVFGRLPAELREMVWRLALTCYEDMSRTHDVPWHYAMAGRRGPPRVDVGLLLTCRAVYVEAYLVPFQVNPIQVFDDLQHDTFLWSASHDPLQCHPSKLKRVALLRPWQLAAISSIEIIVHQFELEGGSIERVSRLIGARSRHLGLEVRGFRAESYASFADPPKASASVGVPHQGSARTHTEADVSDPVELARDLLVGEKISRLTIRIPTRHWYAYNKLRSDSQQQDSWLKLRLEPTTSTTLFGINASSMATGYAARQQGREPDFELDDFERKGCWGPAVGEFWPDLQTLQLVMDTYVEKIDELDVVVNSAKLWTFPQSAEGEEERDGFVLAWDGHEPVTTWWRDVKVDNVRLEWRAQHPDFCNPPTVPLLPWNKGPATQNDVYFINVSKTMLFRRKRITSP